MSKINSGLGKPVNAKIDPPGDAAERIHAYAANGYAKKGIASAFDISTATLQRWMDETPELETAFARGRELERASLHGALYKLAMGGNVVAGLFLLKARHGYREGDQADQANKVSVTFNLPGALTPEQYKTIEAKSTKPNEDGWR